MRKFFLLVLLASAASPALARPDNDGSENLPVFRGQKAERKQADSDDQRQERPVTRPQRNPGSDGDSAHPETGNRRAFGGNSPGSAEVTPSARGQRDPDNADAAHVDRVQRGSAGDSVRTLRNDGDNALEGRVRKPKSPPTLPHSPEVERGTEVTPTGSVARNWRGRDHDGREPASTIEGRNVRNAPNVRDSDGLVQPRHDVPGVFQPTDRRVSRRPVFGTEPPAPSTATSSRAHPTRRWNTDWRHDRRYDWNDWRRHHRNRFHFGFYNDPFGWNYFRYGIGWRMWPSYYGSSFWLRDPWDYRLPPAYGPYRWVRYHYDAVLVNIYTGQVADIVYDFFW